MPSSPRMRPRVTPSLVLLTVALIVVMGLIAIPALAATPSPTRLASNAASAEPSEDGDHDGSTDRQKAADKVKKEHAPEVAVTLSGTIGSTTTAEGETDYTLTVGATTYTLDAGPAWYWKDKHPLKPYVGTSVTVIGEQEQGTTSVDVQSVDREHIRAAGTQARDGR